MSKRVRNCEFMNPDCFIFMYRNTSPKYHKLPGIRAIS